MKNTFLSLSLAGAALLGLSSCEKINEALDQEFTIKVLEVPVQLEPQSTLEEKKLGELTVNFNLDSAIRANTDNRLGVDDIDSVTVEEITVALTNADAANNMRNFESARVQIITPSDPTPQVIAQENNPDGADVQTSMSLDPQQVNDLRDQLQQSNVKYEVWGKARRTTSNTLNGILTVKFKVGA